MPGVALRTDGLLTSLCKKCRQTPILIIPLFPHFLHSPHSASRAVLRAREWIRTARVPVSERGGCFGPSAKKCRQTPFFILPVSSPLFSLLAVGAQGRAGTRDWPSDGAGARPGARRLFRPLCKKCRQTPIFYTTSFLSQITLRRRRLVAVLGMGENGSNDSAPRGRKGAGNGRVEGGGGGGLRSTQPNPLRF